jgi:hypothetical protein
MNPHNPVTRYDRNRTELDHGLLQLQKDLTMGLWDQEYGYLRQQQQYDAGYRFVYTA